MSVRGKLGEFFRVKILSMRHRIASANLPYTCRYYLRIVRRIPSLYRKGCVPRFELMMTCGHIFRKTFARGLLWAFHNWRKA